MDLFIMVIRSKKMNVEVSWIIWSMKISLAMWKSKQKPRTKVVDKEVSLDINVTTRIRGIY